MKLFSILIADRPEVEPGALPVAIRRNVESFQQMHPALPHLWFDEAGIRGFLRRHTEADVLWAYDQLLPYAYRADLARLCLLHEWGGAYADLSVFFHAPLPLAAGKLAVFRDRAVDAPWIVSNTIIGAPPRMPAFEAAIRMIVANCRRRHRGASSLCPTGPVLFGKAIAQHCEPEQIHLGEVLNLAQRDSTEALAFVDATDGRMVGYRTKHRAGLRELGMNVGVNDYNDFYNAGLVYASDYPVLVRADFLAAHGHAGGRLADGLLCVAAGPAREGLAALLRCPLPLPFAAGRYRVVLEVADGSASEIVLSAGTAGGDAAALGCVRAALGGAGAAVLAMPLTVATSRSDLVIAIHAGAGARLRIAGLRIERHAIETTP